MKGMDMPGHDMSQMSAPKADEDSNASDGAMHSMEGRHHGHGPAHENDRLRAPQPGDADRAQKVAETARAVMEKYKDYHVALDNGFKIFLPGSRKSSITLQTTLRIRSSLQVQPEHPTSLLYEKDGDGYRLVGVMYTAPRTFTEDDLNRRIPLSVAQWHEHVNFCRAPLGHWRESWGPNAKFGFKGSIATQAECDAAGANHPRCPRLDGPSLPPRQGCRPDLVRRSPARRLRRTRALPVNPCARG